MTLRPVRNEEDMRVRLAEHRGHPLQEWRRLFYLDQRLAPTAQLWEEVSGRYEPTVGLRDRMSQILALGLGRGWRKARRVAFDPDAASKGLRLYDAAVIPKVDPGFPVEVSEVLRSELTDVRLLSGAEIVRRSALFEEMFG